MGFPKAPRKWQQALKVAVAKWKGGAYVTPGYCLRETRLYYGVGAKYPAAKDSLASALRHGKAYRISNWSNVPRGAIVYWRGGGSQYGHVAPSLGKGYVLSTDWPRGRYGRVHGATLMRSWGYTEAYWSPLVNDVRVWAPKRKPRVNRRRINRALRNPHRALNKEDRRQLNIVVKALRDTRGPAAAKGYPKYTQSVRRALRKFQLKQGWRGKDADGLLGPTTAKRIGLRSFWRKLGPKQ